ncbi:MAG: sterol desaturase family protein [Pseudomonadota bacterium]
MTIFGGIEISEAAFRFSMFAFVLITMVALEVALPKRELSESKSRRWITNFAIVGIDSLAVRLLARLPEFFGAIATPLAAVGAAMAAEHYQIGLFHWIALPDVVVFVATLLILDFAIWLQHYLSHHVPVLWRLHQVHHADADIDVSTAVRFHPVEILLSMLYKIVWVVALGAPALAVVVFEVVLNGCAMFNHANINLPRPLDRLLRMIIVTPDMHRVHHSTLRREHDTNFGFNLSVWDRLFRTYTDQPEGGHHGMQIGLPEYRSGEPSGLLWSLSVPFRGPGRK